MQLASHRVLTSDLAIQSPFTNVKEWVVLNRLVNMML